MTLTEVPTLHPTKEQFEDPIAYLSQPGIKKLGDQYGMVKLVPPVEFKPPLSINESTFRFTPRIQKLKELNITNRCRLFFFKQLYHFNSMNNLRVPEEAFETIDGVQVYYYDFFITCVKHYTPSIKDSLPDISSDRISQDSPLWSLLVKELNAPKRSLQAFYNNKLKGYFDFLSSKPQLINGLVEEKIPTSLLMEETDEELDDDQSDNDEEDEQDSACLICQKNENPKDTLLCDSCDKAFHKYCLNPPLKQIPQNSWYCDNCIIGNGYYGFKDSSITYTLDDFKILCQEFDENLFKNHKPDDVDKLEKMFWEFVDNTNTNDLKTNYGADIHNNGRGQVSGFPTREFLPKNLTIARSEYSEYAKHPMNLNNLPFDKNSLLNYLDADISGMTIPWIYVGSTFSTFCWHVEDQYTLSANYQHLGSTKKWYSIPSSGAVDFESYMQALAPDLFAKQPDILHQLITLVSPFELVDHGINCYTASQQPGEYIITYPRCYHAGFNCGFNFNEAVNFTMTDWLDYGILANNNYKKNVEKVSVFDIWELILNVVKDFIDKSEDYDLALVTTCLERLKSKVTDEYGLVHTVMDKLQDKPTKKHRFNPNKLNEDEDKDEEHEGVLCSCCKSHCSFGYVMHYQSTGFVDYLPTPQNSPMEENRRASKRIKTLKERELYKTSILCCEDYIKLGEENVKDEYYVIKELDSIKKLVRVADNKLNRLKHEHQ